MDIVDELEIGPSYALNSDEKWLRKRAAEEIRRLRKQLADAGWALEAARELEDQRDNGGWL
ncbi:hypothetical protein RsoPWF2_11 [Ralstonia phage vRsoP-WF2]|nr:hypothetical protein RsoPWF2_11 [Ralstonia phage vRsoP-WF2]UHX60302.1 hypothetical protein RsoPWM2_11 [Ralstonia phage vRsoP-WM2]